MMAGDLVKGRGMGPWGPEVRKVGSFAIQATPSNKSIREGGTLTGSCILDRITTVICFVLTLTHQCHKTKKVPIISALPTRLCMRWREVKYVSYGKHTHTFLETAFIAYIDVRKILSRNCKLYIFKLLFFNVYFGY